jgi:hypothetical protein
MSYLDLIKKQIFVEEGKPTPKLVPKPVALPSISATQTAYQVSTDTATNGTSGSLYKKLLSRTDFDTTPTGATINKYLAPFASLPMPEAMKLKAAVAQAAAQEKNITAQSVLAVFDDLKASLQTESQRFDASISSLAHSEVDDPASKISDIDKQIATLQQQKSDLQTAMFTSQGKIESAKAEFAAALKRREQELDTQKESYRSQLQ